MRDGDWYFVRRRFWARAGFYHLTAGLGVSVNCCTLWRALSISLTVYIGPVSLALGWHK